MKNLLFICLMALSFSVSAEKFTISGTMKDAETGEDIIGSSVTVKGESIGASTNEYGFYSLTLEEGDYTLLYRSFGYATIEKIVKLDKNLNINIEFKSQYGELDEVTVTTEKDDENISSTEMSVVTLDPKSIEAVPVLFGEKDVMKTLQLTPGVKSAGEGNSGFYVRGGGADQNLVLLDEAPVYNASHLLGFFSVFNSDAIKDVKLYKGGIPAEYGGRASSVMDVKMRDGNSKKFGASGGIGLISSRLTLEAPIVKDKGSFMISGRRSYLDKVFSLANKLQGKDDVFTLYFYDLNLKSNYTINDNNRVYLSGYFGRDVLKLPEFGFDWGNATGTIRWNHLYNERLFSNTSFVASNYNYKFSFGSDDKEFGNKSGVKDYNLKQSFDYFLDSKNTLKFGLNVIHHTFNPGDFTAGSGTGLQSQKLDDKYALEGGLFIQNDQKLNDIISIQYGLRYSAFNYMGEGTAYNFDNEGAATDTTTYDAWESIQYYGGLEPRFSIKYQLDDVSSLKSSYNRNMQYMHLLSNTTTSSPTDLWIPSSNNVRPQIADQIALGYFRNFKDNLFEFSVEVYGKTLQNQIDYRNGANLFFNQQIEGELVYGKGLAYGAEFYLRKRKGKLTGWVSYTLARSLRQFDDVNNGEWYSARQDRIHDIAIVGIYKINEKLTASANWIFYTGDAVTFPSGQYTIEGVSVPYYTERNGYRFPNYHRMDVGLTWYNKKTEKFESSWNFSIYNVYANKNPYTIDFQENDDTGQTEAIQTTLFQMVPAFTYNFKF